VRMAEVVQPDLRRSSVAERLEAAGQRCLERPGEPLRVQLPPLMVTENERLIADQPERHRPPRLGRHLVRVGRPRWHVRLRPGRPAARHRQWHLHTAITLGTRLRPASPSQPGAQ
jgi:hypothetical protein